MMAAMAGPTMLTRSQLVRPALALVRCAGHDPDELIRRFDLPRTAERDREVIVTLGTVHAFLDAVANLLDEPLLGLQLPAATPAGTYGALEYLGRTAANVRDQLQMVVRYTPLINEVVVVTLTIEDGLAVLRHAVPGEPLCLGRHANECLLARIVNNARHNTGQHVVPTRAWLAHPEPATRARLEAALELPRVEYGQGSNGFALPVSMLDTPLLGADPVLHDILRQHADRELAARRSESRFIGQLRQYLREELADRLPTLASLASKARTNSRALQRRLQAERTSFQALLESVREDIARTRLREPGTTIGDLAFELQYSDESTFVRAFKRWTGMTPGAFRDS